MAAVVSPDQLEWHLTAGIRGVTNSNPFDSLGGQMAAKILDDKLDNLFDPVSAQEQKNGSIEYRWIVLQNKGIDPFKNPHFYFLPQDPNIGIEFSRLAVSAPVSILPTEEERPLEEEIGPEVDVPMPFEKSTEDYDTTLSISPDILAGGKLYICIRRVIPEDSPSENRAFRLVCESRVMQATSTASAGAGGELASTGGALAGR